MGYLGMVGGPNPCADLVTSVLAQFNASFENSPYGFTFDLPGGSAPQTYIPYLIDATTLEVEYRPDLAITSSQGNNTTFLVLDDSTMIVVETGPPAGTFPFVNYTTSVRVITRTGIAISLSGQQATVTNASNFGTDWYCRIDDTHFARTYVPFTAPSTVASGDVLEVFSVSGGVVSLVSSDDLTGPHTITRDPGPPATDTAGSFDWFPFHYDGSGTLYSFCLYQGLPSLLGPFPGIAAIPFSVGGGVGTIGTGTRVTDAQGISRAPIYAAKTGSSECVTIRGGGTRVPFYDDGAHMHVAAVGSSPSFDHIDHDSADQLPGDTMQGNYLASSFTPIGGSPEFNAIVEQSGLTLTRTLINPIFRCPDVIAAIVNFPRIFGCRHGSNLGAMVVNTGYPGPDSTVFAYRW